MLQKISLRRNGQVVHHTEAEEAEIGAATVAVTEADAVVAVIVAVMAVVIVAAQAEVVIRKATADQVTGQPIKVVEFAEAIQAVRLPVRIRTKVEVGLQEVNPGIKNRPENQERRRRGSRKLETGNWKLENIWLLYKKTPHCWGVFLFVSVALKSRYNLSLK
jgi:hypothetical protein